MRANPPACCCLLTLLTLLSTPMFAPAQDDGRTPDTAIAGLDVASDLQVTLIAAEPMLLSPSNIDVDHMGRIWVCEVVNYRRFANADNPDREGGDRILILEDTNGDGLMDRETTFYQGRDIDSAHGVCVLGNRVIVSAGENVFSFYDDDGDLKADRKEVMFTGIKGVQHDHGIHSFTFGPDGRLYFNFGNSGNELHRPNGDLVVDVAGNEVYANRQPYQEGMAFRCELDGSKVDTIGWNFRNNWELTVDSFGTVWQSDNDDDGNQGVRINFVMEYGNYGYKDELTGAGWREPRTGWEDTIPERHWHLNDPGVVPNLLQTGAGSPTGILIYESDLLPERFRNQLIHCDAGPNVVRSYAVKDDGAGYSASINDILFGTRDQWFRPSDVCVAPDGSLIIADWYDPGVGGHRQGDVDRGRLFRVAPPNSKYSVPKSDFSTVEGAVAALKSPNVATRYLAFTALRDFGADAESALSAMFANDPNPRFRARALWLLGMLDGKGQQYVDKAISDDSPDIRIAGIRLARRLELDVAPIVEKLVFDASPQVRRECAIALRLCDSEAKPGLWAKLALGLPDNDRWYLEALGIAADGAWDTCLPAFVELQSGVETPDEHGEKISRLVWRSRGSNSAIDIAGQILSLAATDRSGPTDKQIAAFFRALDFQPKPGVQEAAAKLIQSDTLKKLNAEVTPVVIAEALSRLDREQLESVPDAAAALDRALTDLQGTPRYIALVERFELRDHYADVLTLAQQNVGEQIGIEAVRSLLRREQWGLLTDALKSDDPEAAVATAQVLGNSYDGAIEGPLLATVTDDSVDIDVRREAVRAASKVNNGVNKLVQLVESEKLPENLTQAVAAALHSAPTREGRAAGDRLFPLPPVKEGEALPPISELAKMKGDAKNGQLLFNTEATCHKCHIVGKLGREIGPNLSEIGSKLSREAMFESIIFPSAGISHNYEAYTLVLASGTTITGLITSETDDSVSIKADDGLVREFSKDEVDEKVKQTISLMPADLQKLMSVQDMVDVVEYMLTLKTK